jgi:succinyl-CoA synthetase beta subunit
VSQVGRAVKVFKGAYRAFRDLDATMVEINPLIVTGAGEIMALDAKSGDEANFAASLTLTSSIFKCSASDPDCNWIKTLHTKAFWQTREREVF